MSYMGQDPGELTQNEMHSREPIPTTPRQDEIVWRAPCPDCQNFDGSPDQEQLAAMSYGCVFGCGSKVDRDTGICSRCEDHSANAAECESCGRQYEAWEDGKFAHVRGTPK